MSCRFIIIYCFLLIFTSCNDEEIPMGVAVPSNQTINISEDIIPIQLSTSNNLLGTTFIWYRDKIEEVSGLIEEGNGQTINGLGYVSNLTNTDQIVTYIITPIGPTGNKGNKFTSKILVKNDYIITGTVVDKITQAPVEEAFVYLGWNLCGMGDAISPNGQPASSDSDGKFRIAMSKAFYLDNIYGCKFIYAMKRNYIGSNLLAVSVDGMLEKNFELYHPAQLILRITNDTLTNSIDSAKVYISGEPEFSSYPGFIGGTAFDGLAKIRIKCTGKEFDSTLIYNQLWGNMKYTVQITDYNIGYNTIASYSIILEPDKTNNLSITF